MRCNMTPMALSIAHDTDTSTGTSTSTKGHIIPLNNHQQNKRNGFTDGTISIMLLLCTWQKLMCLLNATYKPQMPIISYPHTGRIHDWCPHMPLLCHYTCLKWSLLQSTIWTGTWVYIHFTFLAYALEQMDIPHCTYVFHYTSMVIHIQTPNYWTCK